jgi:hypothetical protein
MERAILEAVARADLTLCQIGSLPWGKIALSLVLAVAIIKAVKCL